MYSCENVMKRPFANPSSRRPMYIALMLVVTIMITFEIQHKRLAAQILGLRPMNEAMGPAVDELKNAPSVISDDMSC